MFAVAFCTCLQIWMAGMGQVLDAFLIAHHYEFDSFQHFWPALLRTNHSGEHGCDGVCYVMIIPSQVDGDLCSVQMHENSP